MSVAFDTIEGKNTVIDNVSIDIKIGERVGIVGESGSGKTLTSLSLLRLMPSANAQFSAGEITLTLDGKELQILSLERRELNQIRGKEIGIIFQEPGSSLDPVYKCGSQVDEVYLTHISKDRKAAAHRTLELFEQVKLHDPERIYNSYPHEISGGQLQRVMIAMALVCRPKLLIADEPTTALDVTIQREIVALIKEITEQFQMSLLFISHDLALVSQICERVYVMYQGKIVEKGEISEVFVRPKHSYTKALLECRPDLSKRSHSLMTVDRMMDKAHTKEPQQVERRVENDVLLKMENVHKTYYKRSLLGLSKQASTEALHDVSFELKRKEILGIVGESGSGKSTLIKCILGIEDVDQGAIYFSDQKISTFTNRQWKPYRKKIQIVFQDPYSSLNPKMRVGHAVKEVLQVIDYQGDRKEKVEELFELVGMDQGFYNRYPHQLSGGQRQRVCIARALAIEPELLLCDECVSALDVSVQAQILNLLLDLRASQNLSVIFITHDFSVVSYLCDRIVVLNEGRIVEVDLPGAIIKNPKEIYTKNLIESIPKFATR